MTSPLSMLRLPSIALRAKEGLTCLISLTSLISLPAFSENVTFSNPAATNRLVILTPLQLTPGPGQSAVYDRQTFTTDTNGCFTVTNMTAGTWQVAVQAPPDLTTFAILVSTNADSVTMDKISIAMPRTVTHPQDYSYSASASDARYAVAGGGGLAFVPQMGSQTLSNWALLGTNVLDSLAAGGLGTSTNPVPAVYASLAQLGGVGISNNVVTAGTMSSATYVGGDVYATTVGGFHGDARNLTGSAAGMTNLNGAAIQAGTVSSNALDPGTLAQFAQSGVAAKDVLGRQILTTYATTADVTDVVEGLLSGSTPPSGYFVAATGSDTNPGTVSLPWRTLEHAQTVMRSAGPTNVYVRAGTYYRTSALALTTADNGQTWSAYPGETVTLVGGLPITNFQMWQGNILVTDVSTQGFGQAFTQLLFNGVRQTLARYPNYSASDPYGSGFNYVVGSGSRTQFTNSPGDVPRTWAHPTEAQVFIYTGNSGNDFWNNIVPVAAIDRANNTVYLASGTSYASIPGTRYYFQNALEELDAPGEWYLDGSHRYLVFLAAERSVRGDAVGAGGDQPGHDRDRSAKHNRIRVRDDVLPRGRGGAEWHGELHGERQRHPVCRRLQRLGGGGVWRDRQQRLGQRHRARRPQRY